MRARPLLGLVSGGALIPVAVAYPWVALIPLFSALAILALHRCPWPLAWVRFARAARRVPQLLPPRFGAPGLAISRMRGAGWPVSGPGVTQKASGLLRSVRVLGAWGAKAPAGHATCGSRRTQASSDCRKQEGSSSHGGTRAASGMTSRNDAWRGRRRDDRPVNGPDLDPRTRYRGPPRMGDRLLAREDAARALRGRTGIDGDCCRGVARSARARPVAGFMFSGARTC